MCKKRTLYLGNIAVNNQHLANAVKMGKVSHADKMRMQTLRERGCGANAIIRAYPYKEWKLSLSRTASSGCQPGSFSSKMALQHTRHVSRRSSCTQTVLGSLRRTVGHQIPQISTPLTTTCGGAMLERYHKLQPKPKTIAELKAALQLIWDDMPQEPINEGRQGLHQTAEGMRAGQWWSL